MRSLSCWSARNAGWQRNLLAKVRQERTKNISEIFNMIVQIYEVSNPIEAKKLAEIGVDHIGLLVGKGKYPRELSYEKTKRIFEACPKETKRVALSLSSNLKEISELVKKTNPDILHLGTLPQNFSPLDVKKLKQKFPKLKIMRSIPVVGKESINLAKKYEEIADYLLLDTYKKEDSQVGATGEIHDWDISKKIVDSVKIPVILAGGLGADNVAEAIRKVKPAGVDSKTKTDKTGSHEKDINKVKEFVKIAKAF